MLPRNLVTHLDSVLTLLHLFEIHITQRLGSDTLVFIAGSLDWHQKLSLTVESYPRNIQWYYYSRLDHLYGPGIQESQSLHHYIQTVKHISYEEYHDGYWYSKPCSLDICPKFICHE